MQFPADEGKVFSRKNCLPTERAEIWRDWSFHRIGRHYDDAPIYISDLPGNAAGPRTRTARSIHLCLIRSEIYFLVTLPLTFAKFTTPELYYANHF